MAGNRVQYIIDLVVQDQQLKRQLAGLDWEKLIGADGKGLSDAFNKSGKQAADHLKNIFHGINIDWKSILGEADLARLETQLERIVHKNTGNIQKWLDVGDTSNVEAAVNYVSALGQELSELGSSFDSHKMAKSMGAFLKVIAPLAGETQKIEKAFGGLFTNMTQSSAKITQVMAKIDAATKRTGGSQATLNKLVQQFHELQNIKLPDLSSFNLDQLEAKMDELDDKWDALESKFNGKKNSNAFKFERAKILQEMLHVNSVITNKGGDSFYTDDMIKDMKSDVQHVINEFKSAIQELKSQLDSKSFAQSLSKQLNDIQIKLSVSDSAKEELKGKINAFVDEINNGGLNPAKIQIDYSLKNTDVKDGVAKNIDVDKLKETLQSEIDLVDEKIAELKKQKQHYEEVVRANPKNKTAKHHAGTRAEQIEELTKQQEANKYLLANIQDESVQRALTSSANDFKAIHKVMSAQQSAILTDTQEWRTKMIDLMKFAKEDVDFSFSFGAIDSMAESLLDELNAFFAEHAIDVTINKEKLKQDIAEAFGQGGVSVGGGGVSIDANTLVSAIATGLQAALTGDFTPVTDKNSNKNASVKTPVSSAKTTFLNSQDPYNAYMGKAFIDIAKYAQGKGRPAEAIRNFFNRKFDVSDNPESAIDLEKIADSESLTIALEGLAQVIKNGGNTLDSEFKELVGSIGNNKALSTFGADLSELLYTLNISQTSLKEGEISQYSIDIFKDFMPKQQLVSGINKIFQLDDKDLASLKLEDIEGTVSIAKNISEKLLASGNTVGAQKYQSIIDRLSALKAVKENIGDIDDESKQQQLASAVSEFKQGVESTYNELVQYVNSFDMHAYVKGRSPMRVKGGKSGRSLSRLLNAVRGDWTKLEDVTLQQYPNNVPIGILSRHEEQRLLRHSGKDTLYRPAPDRTDILNQNAAIPDFTPTETAIKKWQDTSDAGVRAAQRAKDATKMLEIAETKKTSLTKIDTEFEQQIQEKQKQVTALENQIAENKEKVNKIVGNDGRKVAGAQRRLQNSATKVEETSRALTLAEEELERAKLEKESADRIYQQIQDEMSRGTYKQIDEADAQIAMYEQWKKNPLKYRKDMIGEIKTYTDKAGVPHQRLEGGIYEDDYRNAMHYRSEAQSKIKDTKLLLDSATNKVSNLQKQVNKFGETPELKKALDTAIAEEQYIRKQLDSYQRQANENQAILDDIYRKRKGTAKEDKADFTADVKRKVGGYYDENGDFIPGKLQHAISYRSSLGADPRAEAEEKVAQASAILDEAKAVVERAKAENDKALKKQREVQKSDKYVKKATQVNELSNKNDELSREASVLNDEIARATDAKNKNASAIADNEAQARIKATEGLKSSIEALITRQDALEKNIMQSKAEAEDIDQFVAKKMKQSGHKTPTDDIGYKKKDIGTIDKYFDYTYRSNYLDTVASDQINKNYVTPKNLTANMKQIVQSLTDSRAVVKLLNSTKSSLDRFESEGDLQAEVKKRLDSIARNKKSISPIVTEYYNKILNDGQNGAVQWLESQMSSAKQNIDIQTQKLISLSQADINRANELKPKVDELDEGLKQTYQTRINEWINSLQQKMAYLETGNLSTKDSMLAVKEIEGLFELTHKAILNYNKKYISKYDDGIKKENNNIASLQKKLQAAIQKGDDVEVALIEGKIENAKAIIKEYEKSKKELTFLTPEQESLMSKRHAYIYDRRLNENTNKHEKELAGNITDTKSQISERNMALEARRAELLKEIQDASKSGASTTTLQNELKGINDELQKYQQYTKMMEIGNLFDDDVGFADEYKNKLAEIITLEQELDLAMATGAPSSDLESKSAIINAKQAELDQSVYGKLQTKQRGLLVDIETFTKEGKSVNALEGSLNSVNKLLTEYELHKRRIAQSDVGVENSLFGASEYVVGVYNEQIKETIRLEQELALLRAKSQDEKNDQAVKDAKAALSRQKSNATKQLVRAINEQADIEARGSVRYQALEYLRATEKAYQTGYQQRYAVKARKKKVEGLIEDVAPGKNYQNTALYKEHLNKKKNRLTNEYVHSEDYQSDRDAGIDKALQETFEYVKTMIRPVVEDQLRNKKIKTDIDLTDEAKVQKKIDELVEERSQGVMYRLKQSLGKTGEKFDLSNMNEAYGLVSKGGWEDIRKSIEEEYESTPQYQALIQERENKRAEALEREIQAIEEEGRRVIELIQTAQPSEYDPLKKEMAKNLTKANVETIEKEFKQVLSGVGKKTNTEKIKKKLLEIARNNGANQFEKDDLFHAIEANISNIRHGKAQNILPQLMSVFQTDEDLALKHARASLINRQDKSTERRIDNLTTKHAQGKFYADTETETAFREKLDYSIRKYIEERLKEFELGVDDETFDKEAGVSTKIIERFKGLMKEYVYTLSEKFAENLHAGDMKMGSAEDIRQDVEDELTAELDQLKLREKEINEEIARSDARRKKAIEVGGINRKDIADVDILKQQAAFEHILTTEKEKQREIAEEIARLEKEGNQGERLGQLYTAMDASKDISDKMQMLIGNRDNLIDLQHRAKEDEKAEKAFTPEEQKLWYTNALEAAKLSLESDDPTKQRLAEERIARYTDILSRLEAEGASQEPEDGTKSILSTFADLIKGAGGIALDASGLASQTTLEQIADNVARILVTIGGDSATSIVKDPAMEGKLARIRELENKYGGKPGQKINVSTNSQGGNAKASTANKEEIKIKDFEDFKTQVNSLKTAIENEKSDVEKQRQLQEKLIATLQAWAKTDPSKLGGILGGKKTSLNEKEWVKYLTDNQILSDINTELTPLTHTHLKSIYKTSSASKNNKVASGEKIMYDKSDYSEYNKLIKETKDYKPQIVQNEVDGLAFGLAKDETLNKILDRLNSIAKNGLPKSSKSSSATQTAKKTEAELIRDRALIQDEVVRKLSAGKANLYDKYVKDVEDLNNAVKEANKADDKHKERAINKVKNAADRVTALSRNIIRDTSDWEYKSSQGEVLKSFKKKHTVDQTYMENLAKSHAGVSKGQNQYKFLSFDGNVLTYQLTDIEGKVRKVTMEWNAFNKEIAITSDKSVYKLTELAGKVEGLNHKFDEAKNIGFLDEKDSDLKAFYAQLKKIDDLIKNNASFKDVDKARGKAIALGGVVSAKINKNKRAYNGSGLGVVDRQYGKVVNAIGTQDDFDNSEIGLVQQYKKAYADLHNKYKEVYKDKQVLNDKEQKDLMQQTLAVQNLGKQVITQLNEEQELRDKVANSGGFKNFQGQYVQLGGIKENLTEEQVATNNLKATMLDYAKSLGMTDLSNIKFNKTTKQLTGTIRTSSDTVADIAIKYHEASNALFAYNQQEKESLSGIRGLIQGFKSKLSSIMQYTASITSIYRVFGEFKKGVQYVREIDSALTELKKVTNETTETYDRFLDTAAKTADKVGSTIQQVVNSAADWARIGYSLEEAATLAESTSVLLNVSEFQSIDEATSALTSTMQAFGYTATQSMDVVDVLNEVGKLVARR